jgi:hypothetical protein
LNGSIEQTNKNRAKMTEYLPTARRTDCWSDVLHYSIEMGCQVEGDSGLHAEKPSEPQDHTYDGRSRAYLHISNNNDRSQRVTPLVRQTYFSVSVLSERITYALIRHTALTNETQQARSKSIPVSRVY